MSVEERTRELISSGLSPRAANSIAASEAEQDSGGGGSSHGALIGVTANQHHDELHAAAHAEGEADEITLVAAAVSFTPVGIIAATNVQEAIEEAAEELGENLTSHRDEVSEAHIASAIGFAADGIAATDVQAAIEEAVAAIDALGISAFIETLLPAVDAAAARAVLETADATAHGCSIKHSTTQTVDGALTFDTDLEDADGYHDPGSNPTRVTVPAGLGGLHLVTFSSAGEAGKLVRTQKGGATLVSPNVYADAGAYYRYSWPVRLAAGEYIEIMSAAGSAIWGHASAFEAQTLLNVWRIGA